MADSPTDNLLARLAGRKTGNDSQKSWAAIPTTQPQHAAGKSTSAAASAVAPSALAAGGATAVAEPPAEPSEADGQGGRRAPDKLDDLLKRLSTLTAEGAVREPPAAAAARPPRRDEPNTFLPVEPETLADSGLTETQLEALLLKYLLARGNSTGRDCADQVKLPFKLVEAQLRQMKSDQVLVYYGTAPMNDYVYQLTDLGRERARRYAEICSYFGSAPVPLKDYIASVGAQSLTHQHPSSQDLHWAFQDLLINKHMLNRLGPAINSGRGLFLYGSAGNGKTSIAERITRAFGEHLWIPRAVGVDGEIIRIYDPSNHEESPTETNEGLLDQRRIDRRWVRIRRPTIVVGGELTMDNLEVTLNTSTGISEAPIQMKSNCGTLVIDDFGRQRMRTDELMNRWIVPLEKRFDFLNLPNGKKIQVPFDQLIVFSTNLEPKDLVDEAFLRRIPYKIEIKDPTDEEFRELFRLVAPKMSIEYRDDVIDYLIDHHYRRVHRPLRCCQPRDLLLQMRNYCLYQGTEPHMSRELADFAVENYFAVM
jgi:hypothetical protein